jgi:L-malate glycosyltransferase
VRLLFVNHTGARSGAENAMLRLLEALPPEYERAVACPPAGGLKEALGERGIEQHDLTGTEVSVSLHPVRTAGGLARLLRSALSLRATARGFHADVIHANSIRAGLIGEIARRLGGPPVVVQCHDHLPRNRVGHLIRTYVARGAEAVVAVSDATAREFNHGLARPKAERIYISVDQERFSPERRGDSGIRAELGLRPDARLLGEVAQITPWKGQDTAIKALPRIRERFDAHLLVVGDVAFSSQRYDNVGFLRSLESLVAELGLESAVHFLGRRDDVPDVIGALDMLLLPSWDEPFGLVVAEAMAIGTPVLVTQRGGVREYVDDGANGRLLPPHEPDAWGEAVIELLGDDEALERLGRASVATAAQFNDERYCREMLAVYERAANA